MGGSTSRPITEASRWNANKKKITNEKKKRRKSREAERDGPANECAVPDSGAAGLRRDLICRLAGVLLRETPSVVVATPTANVRRPAPYPPPTSEWLSIDGHRLPTSDQ